VQHIYTAANHKQAIPSYIIWPRFLWDCTARKNC